MSLSITEKEKQDVLVRQGLRCFIDNHPVGLCRGTLNSITSIPTARVGRQRSTTSPGSARSTTARRAP